MLPLSPFFKNVIIVEAKEYFEKVMQDFNQNRKGRSLRKYCSDEGGDYKWPSECKRLPSLHVTHKILVFMYSLYESCKMNNLSFGRYIEDILTRMKDGNKDYRAMLPCFYVEKTSEVMWCA